MRALLLIATLFAGPAAVAQSLPAWAEPSKGSAPSGPATMAAPPGLPGGGGAPAQVPLDGGLGLLALAGGAYAMRRLRAR